MNSTDTAYRQANTDEDALRGIRWAAEAEDTRELDSETSRVLRDLEIDANFPDVVDALAVARHRGSALRARRLELQQDTDALHAALIQP